MKYFLFIFVALGAATTCSSQKEDFYSDTLSSNISQYSGKNNSLEVLLSVGNGVGFRYRNYKNPWVRELYFSIDQNLEHMERELDYMNDTALFSFNPAQSYQSMSLEFGLGKMQEFWGWSSRLSVGHYKVEKWCKYDYLKYYEDANTGNLYFEQLAGVFGRVETLNYQTIEEYTQRLDYLKIGLNSGIEVHANINRFLVSLGMDVFLGCHVFLREKGNDPRVYYPQTNANVLVFEQFGRFGLGYSF